MATERRRSSVLQDLLNQKQKGEAGRVALVDSDPFKLASFGLLDLLKVLVEEKGVDVNAKLTRPASAHLQDDRDCTPLIWAVRANQLQVAEYLLERGADIESPSFLGMRPVHHACSGILEGMLELLLEKGASCESLDEMGNTPLHYAAARGVLSLISKLSKADVNGANIAGTTPLMKAAVYGQAAIVLGLLNKGAQADMADKAGNAALHMAARGGHEAVVKALLAHNAELASQKNKRGKTPADMTLTPSIAALFDEPQ